ncbi:solute carrier family 25 member 38 [Diplodia corticola]|uniref:Mitochondrial glycine transporter n=1 Tax=Diplodia corticola TaxID=236234 RepID=A0A1J9RFA8_9PEZI|nr:solute carrier family 25 member 38 [Diplodia corticola]OJD38770.1 solute carrier family 25 member 38 [Diplodia corticola]
MSDGGKSRSSSSCKSQYPHSRQQGASKKASLKPQFRSLPTPFPSQISLPKTPHLKSHRPIPSQAPLTASLQKNPVHFLAGLSSGVLSAVLLQPADLLKTRVQQSRSTTLSATLTNILRGPDPVRSLWRGTVPSALRTGFGSALYFTTLNALRTSVAKSEAVIHHRNNNNTTGGSSGQHAAGGGTSSSSSSLVKLSRLGNLVTGAVARASAGFVMMPVTVIKVRFESSYYAYRSLWAAGADIRKTHGVRGFFAGFGATAVRDAPYAGLYVLFYEESKKALGRMAGVAGTAAAGATGASVDADQEKKAAVMGGGEAAAVNFASGVVAAGLGTALTNPFDAIKTRLQLLPDRYANMAHAARLMLREEGVGSLFDGLGLRMARKALSSALAWTLYEELIRRAERRFVASEEAVLKG